VSAASGAVFRIGFGVVGLILVARFLSNGWVDSLLTAPRYHFTYPGLEWVRPWPEPWMHVHFLIIGASAAAIALGYRYRVAVGLFAVSLAYVELIDRTLYLNHYYWLVLTAVVMVFLPLGNSFSIDARAGRVADPGWYPAWVVWMLRFQVGMVYFFAGLAKLNSDWLLRAEPLATWLPARSDMWLIGPTLALPATAFAMSWAGAFFDLTIVGWLSWRRTRLVAYLSAVVFHTATWALFPSIGLFPVLMSLSALVFFDPGWPARFLPEDRRSATSPRPGRLFRPWVVLGAAYVALMVVIPLRHHLVPGDVKWTGEGYLGSWQVMLTEKSGSAEFVVNDPVSGDEWVVPPPEYLTERQRMVMATDPVMIRQTARLIAEDLGGGVEVAADVRLAFNGRASIPFTDRDVVVSTLPLTTPIPGFVLPPKTG
jgi:hypothetical protein